MIINLSISIINLILLVFFYKNYLHIYQLKDYRATRYLSYFKIKTKLIFIINLLSTILIIFIKNNVFNLIFNTILILLNNYHNKKLIKNKKTPLKYTKKIIRIYIISTILLLLSLVNKLSIALSNLLIIFMPIISNNLNIYDQIKNKWLIRSAKIKLKNSNTKIIAITGSNGKTSVKNILHKMLATQYDVQATPKSYNTPLGISTFINNELSNKCDYLILEYGARRPGDIKKLCKLFGADYGIITLVAPQHLATFKSIENIYKTKKELSDFLKDSPCVYNLDNIYTHRMYEDKSGCKIGTSINRSGEIYARNIKVENFQTLFDLFIGDQTFHCSTKLLGRHNINNIILSLSLAFYLDVNIKNLIQTISNLTPTSHRLEYIRGAINILDDSYNCSLASAKESINVLLSTTGKKMIATPGIIEGGKDEYLINKKLGKLCKDIDYIIIIGNHNKFALLDGLRGSTTRIFIVYSLEDAKQYFSLLQSKDSLLLLNDLPDDYT